MPNVQFKVENFDFMVFYLHTSQSKYTNFKDRADFLELARTVYKLRDLNLNCGLRVLNLDESNDPVRVKMLSDFFLQNDGSYANIRSYVAKTVVSVDKDARELTDNFGNEVKPLSMKLANRYIERQQLEQTIKEVKKALEQKQRKN